MGHTKSSRWKGTGLAFPKDHKSTLEAIHWARMAAKEDEHTTTILIVNYKDWTTQQLPLKDHADIHIIATIPPHTIQYVPTPEWPKYYQYTEPTLTSIICIHNQPYPTPNIQTPQELQHILRRTLNTHIDTYPIAPTNTQYKVKFSKAWINAPKSHPPPINHKTTPLPTKYNHIHPLKFHPHQCIYTDGSFIPPTKNSAGNIEGNTAGSGVYSPNNNTRISERLPGYQNILRAELNAILIAIKTIRPQKLTHIYSQIA